VGGFGGSGPPAVILLAARFVVSSGLEVTGVTAWAGQLLIKGAGEESRTRLLMLTMGLVSLLTALISVNGAVAALLPFARDRWLLVAILAGMPLYTLGGVLATHPNVNKITFTGSTGVGRTLMAQGAATIKSMSLELGGHAPILVFDDCDLDLAVAETIKSKFRNGGQAGVRGNPN